MAATRKKRPSPHQHEKKPRKKRTVKPHPAKRTRHAHR